MPVDAVRELLEQRPAVVAAADDLAGVDVEDLIDIALSRADVPDLSGEAARQLRLQRDVERVDVAALRFVRQRTRGDVQRDRTTPLLTSGHHDGRNPVTQPSREPDAGCRNGQADRRGIVADEIADERERIGIVVPAVAAASHHLLGDAVGHAESWGQVAGPHVVVAVRWDARDAADQHRIRVEVVPLDAAGGSGAHREVIPAHAQRRGQRARHLPLVFHERAELPVARPVAVVLVPASRSWRWSWAARAGTWRTN